MSRSIVSQLRDETGLSPVTTEYRFDGLQHLYFKPELSYESFVEAVARVNADSAYGMAVWGCGRSTDEHLVAAVQVFDALKEQADLKLEETDGISWGEYSGDREATKRAERDAITEAR
jgi:hypothetical protein